MEFKNLLIMIPSILLLLLTLAARVSGAEPEKKPEVMFDADTVPKHCLEAKPMLSSNYVPTGFEWTHDGNLTIYETKNTNYTKLLFVAYDIFGYHPNTKQVADLISEAGQFRVVMPDFFRGGWALDDYPPANKTPFLEFVNTNGSWANVSRDLKSLIRHYKEHDSIHQFGIFGFCWGGKVSVLASTDIPEIRAAGLIHPSVTLTSDAEKVKSPMYLLPSKDEPDMIPFYNIILEKFGAKNVGYKLFSDMHHGFASARGNFDDPANKAAVEEVIEILQKYFNEQLE